ncbi:hypothetical protein [Alkalihalophilus marmarensis]|uniref:Uncharacterized protein n=1 Tax=Alkalihalophilus marmarensis DSM 21297 TaxID=1188261 RepID=U6SSV9_9BACI|nr:hypothetical protein [Alkalihalophilus marmarensis]ERN53985.1 hypothetical protein A33I_09275 [Alkalihalophilus marmarensis DSM 21297]
MKKATYTGLLTSLLLLTSCSESDKTSLAEAENIQIEQNEFLENPDYQVIAEDYNKLEYMAEHLLIPKVLTDINEQFISTTIEKHGYLGLSLKFNTYEGNVRLSYEVIDDTELSERIIYDGLYPTDNINGFTTYTDGVETFHFKDDEQGLYMTLRTNDLNVTSYDDLISYTTEFVESELTFYQRLKEETNSLSLPSYTIGNSEISDYTMYHVLNQVQGQTQSQLNKILVYEEILLSVSNDITRLESIKAEGQEIKLSGEAESLYYEPHSPSISFVKNGSTYFILPGYSANETLHTDHDYMIDEFIKVYESIDN